MPVAALRAKASFRALSASLCRNTTERGAETDATAAGAAEPERAEEASLASFSANCLSSFAFHTGTSAFLITSSTRLVRGLSSRNCSLSSPLDQSEVVRAATGSILARIASRTASAPAASIHSPISSLTLKLTFLVSFFMSDIVSDKCRTFSRSPR